MERQDKRTILRAAGCTLIMLLTLGIGTRPAGAVDIPFEQQWASSGHADTTAEAFNHWNGDGEVSASCAKCHSTPGFLDFLGEDGTAFGSVENPAPIGTTVECVACHNTTTLTLDSVVFPSGKEVLGLGDESRCMQCHQGRESTPSVDASVAGKEEDTIDASLRFRNIHYYFAGATLYGTQAMGGYEYEGKSYDVKFAHVDELSTCITCHNPHTLEVNLDKCTECHAGVTTHEDTHNIRHNGSLKDYDGDGDTTEGIYYEIETLRDKLYAAIQAYASAKGAPIIYSEDSYPYFFNDTNMNGEADPEEVVSSNGYKSFTPRLVKATYNLQFSIKDPGNFAHGGKYVIELLYDSIENLDPAAVAGLRRTDAGHFAGSNEPFRHWDSEGEVSASCSKCHSAEGLPTLATEGVMVPQPVSNGFKCSTCHDAIPEFTRYQFDEVEFPSGAVLSLTNEVDDPKEADDKEGNLCINCHQGRESTVSVNAVIAGLPLDTVSSKVRFRNVHYYAAGATLFGSQAKGAYEYPGKSYNGRNLHREAVDTCIECHDTHKLEIKTDGCQFCHGTRDPHMIRHGDDHTDWDGDGNTTEPFYEEVMTMHEKLLAAIQDYAANVIGQPIAYDGNGYPYFFKDNNGNGVVDPEEASRSNGYSTWTPRLLQAAYNYQFVVKDPGSFAHNGRYILQCMYDGLESLGTQVAVNMNGMVRPEVENSPAECGDASHPFPVADMNGDCIVNMPDLSIVSNQWLWDTNPQ